MADCGIGNDYCLPDDRSAWHPAVRHVYDYWLAIAPPGRLPGRQDFVPEDIAPLLPRILLVEVHRHPLRFRYRLVGGEVAWSRVRDPTGQWLDVLHGKDFEPYSARYRYIADTGRATWRRGQSMWDRDPKHVIVENCLMPLAKDGCTVDMIFGVSMVFGPDGKELHGAGLVAPARRRPVGARR